MTLELYPASAHDAFHGTAMQFPQHVDEAVQQIHGACQGLGTDEMTLITVLGSKAPETRNLIALRYKELYHKPLKDMMKSETSGDFGRLLRMISTPLPETEAQILRDATKGMGTTESLIVQILSGRTNEEMNILKRTYFDLVGKDLAVTLNSELSGDFRKVVMAVLQSPQVAYNPAVHNAAKAEEDAIALYKAGQGRLGTNEEVFIGLIVKAPPEFLKMMDAVYVAKYNNNIAKAVDKEFSGDAKKSLNYIVRSILDPYPAIAEAFEKTMKGFGTDETGLSTVLVRYQCVLPHVKAVYKKLYHEELRDRISGETSGDYKKLLLEIFDAPLDPPRTNGSHVSHGAASAPAEHSRAVKSPAYVSTQASYAASSSGPPSASYSAPAGQNAYTPSPQAPPGQTAYGTSPSQAATSQPGGYSPQSPSGGACPSQPSAQTQAQAPGYPTPQQPSGYAPQQQGHSTPQYSPQNQPGYPSPQGSYSQHQPGYPTQQPGYPVPPQQPGYSQPQQNTHQSGYQQPQQNTQQPGYPQPQQNTQQPGYSQTHQQQGGQQPSYPPQAGYSSHHQQPGYPPQSGYQQGPSYSPTQPGFQQQLQPSYPQQPAYPPQGQPNYPQPGYPTPAYPAPQQQPPNQSYQQYALPGQQGYPPAYGGAPPPHGNYPPLGGYPAQSPGYPGQPQYPPPGGYPPYRGQKRV